MPEKMGKKEARTWMAVMQEHLDAGLVAPGDVVERADQLGPLHECLIEELRDQAQKVQKALNPVAGQRITPDSAWQDIQQALWHVTTLLRFSLNVMVRQRHTIAQLRAEIGRLHAETVSRKPPAAARASSKKKASGKTRVSS